MSNTSLITIDSDSIINHSISIKQEEQSHIIDIQGMLVDLYFADTKFGCGHLYLLYNVATHLCAWRFNVIGIHYKKKYYGSSVSNRAILPYYSYTNEQKKSLVEKNLTNFLNTLSIYSSEEELLFFVQVDATLFFREPKYNNERASTFEEARQKVVHSLTDQLHEFEKYRYYRVREIRCPIESNAYKKYEGNFFVELPKRRVGETSREFRRRTIDPLGGPPIVAKVSLIKKVIGGWRIVMDSSEDRRMTYILDTEFNVLDAVAGVALD